MEQMNDILKKPNEWQYIDNRSGLIFPWYTQKFLQIIKNWDVSEWTVMQFGSGASTLWWAKNCKKLISVDADKKWHNYVAQGLRQLNLNHKVDFYCFDTEKQYSQIINNYEKFDCIIIDGHFRMRCASVISEKNIKYNGIIILDNYQDYRDITQIDIFRSNQMHLYPQPNHHYWRTAYWIINNFNFVGNNHQLNSLNQAKKRGIQ